MSFSANYQTSPLSASNIRNFSIDVSEIAAQQGGGTGLIYVAVTDGITGKGIVGDPLLLKDNQQHVTVTLTNYASGNHAYFNDMSASQVTGAFKGDGCKITNITASGIPNFTADTRAQLSAGANLGYSSGQFSLNADVNTTSVTASLNGNGSQVTNITASNIPNFTADTRAQFSAGTNVSITSGVVSTVNVPARSEVTGALTPYATLTGVSGTFTTPLQVTGAFSVVTASNAVNALTASYVATASAIPTFTNDVRNQLSAGANLNYSSGQFALNANVNTTSVTASFNGNGSQITNITASNITNFTNNVRAQFTAGQNISITTGTVSFSGVLPIANGGTGLSSSGVSGNLLISNGTGLTSQTVTQDLSITSGGVATVKGLYTNPLRSPSVTPPVAGNFLKWGGTDWFPAPVSATVAVGSLQLTADPPQTITANGQTILPTSAYWRLLSAGNFNAGPINYAGAGLGQVLFIQVPIGQAGSVTFNKGVGLALGSNTRKVSAGGSLQLIYDGTQWVEMFFNTSTST